MKIIVNTLITVIGLSTGAAIVHGTVLQQCETKNEPFIAGVLPEDTKNVQKQQQSDGSDDIQKCFDRSEDYFVAGVLPEQQPSVQGATPIASISVQTTKNQASSSLSQSSAPAPSPQPKAQPAIPSAQKQQKKPASLPAKKQPPKTTNSPKPLSYNLDKLSMAVAMHETHNCTDKKGSALYNNCHGFRKNGKFMRFSSKAESHAYFKQLWARSYRSYPNMRLAKIYSGNDNPTNWLKNVNYYYHNL